MRRKPYSVVLFDELEKGDPEVFNVLLQILEDGEVTDGKGRKIDFRNTVIVMTSNLGGEEFNASARKIGFDASPADERSALADFDKARAAVLKTLEKRLKPEFMNRIDKVVVFRPLGKEAVARIAELGLSDLKNAPGVGRGFPPGSRRPWRRSWPRPTTRKTAPGRSGASCRTAWRTGWPTWSWRAA